MYNLDLNLQTESCDYNLKDVLNALSKYQDEDFNGNNGDEYLWDTAKGFKSNQEYLLHELNEKYTDKMIKDWEILGQLVGEYFNEWLGKGWCYKDYEFSIHIDEASKRVHISCAWLYGG